MKKKTFDCVRMKWDIQRKQREELAGMSEADKRRVQTERIKADPILMKRLSGPERDAVDGVPSDGAVWSRLARRAAVTAY